MAPETDQPETVWLLISDVDDTLTGDAAALQSLGEAIESRRDKLFVALNSSRPAASVDRTVAEVFPPGFPIDAVVTAMGTEVRFDGIPSSVWSARFEGWPRDDIAEAVTALGHTPHDAEFQTAFKASFAVPRGSAQEEVRDALAERGLPCRIIASGADDLDILPPDAGKDHATRFVHEHFRREHGVSADHLVVAGDSANDLAMFQTAPHAIAVGNARDELITAMPPDRSYRARAHHAAGVLEGLRHFASLPSTASPEPWHP